MFNKQKTIEKIQEFSLMDDTFMSKVFEDNIPATQLLLQIIMKNDKLTVKEVHSQYTLTNLLGRSVRLDILACDEYGNYMNIEVQRKDNGAIPRRARYNSSLVDTLISEQGAEYCELPDTCIIFITEKDVLKEGRALYTIQRRIVESNNRFEDGNEIIYVNSQIQDETALGRLMADFHKKDPAKMHYKELAESVQHYKYSTEGVEDMCKIMEDLMEESREEGMELTILVLTKLKAGESPEKVHAETGMSMDRIVEIQKLQSA